MSPYDAWFPHMDKHLGTISDCHTLNTLTNKVSVNSGKCIFGECLQNSTKPGRTYTDQET